MSKALKLLIVCILCLGIAYALVWIIKETIN